MYFLIFQPDDMLNLCLTFSEFLTTYAYKCHTYTKRVYQEKVYQERYILNTKHRSTIQTCC